MHVHCTIRRGGSEQRGGRRTTLEHQMPIVFVRRDISCAIVPLAPHHITSPVYAYVYSVRAARIVPLHACTHVSEQSSAPTVFASACETRACRCVPISRCPICKHPTTHMHKQQVKCSYQRGLVRRPHSALRSRFMSLDLLWWNECSRACLRPVTSRRSPVHQDVLRRRDVSLT